MQVESERPVAIARIVIMRPARLIVARTFGFQLILAVVENFANHLYFPPNCARRVDGQTPDGRTACLLG